LGLAGTGNLPCSFAHSCDDLAAVEILDVATPKNPMVRKSH
jgi:hypothetical protein